MKLPWVHDGLLELIHTRNDLFKKAIVSKNPNDWTAAKRARNRAQILITKARSDYVQEHINDPKKIWKAIREILPESKGVHNFHLIDQDNNTEIPDDKVADFINSYFANIGPKLAAKFINIEWKANFEPTYLFFQFAPFSEKEVLELINNMHI